MNKHSENQNYNCNNISFSELRHKEVINICNGCRIGYVCDLELDISCCKLLSIIVIESQKLFCFKKQTQYRIPIDCIDKISNDIILVRNAFEICDEKTRN